MSFGSHAVDLSLTKGVLYRAGDALPSLTLLGSLSPLNPDRNYATLTSSGRYRVMRQPETYFFADDGCFPNSRLPLLVYREALDPDVSAMEEAFAAHGWANAWRDGIFTCHCSHGIAHEVLGIAQGEVRVMFGGPSGQTVTARAGDVVVIPAGVAHRNMGQTDDLLVVGAYPGGSDYNTLRGDPSQYAVTLRAIAGVPLPKCDPVWGRDGPLQDVWTHPVA